MQIFSEQDFRLSLFLLFHGGCRKLSTFKIAQALEVARKVFERRKMKFDKTEEKILRYIFEKSTKHRAW